MNEKKFKGSFGGKLSRMTFRQKLLCLTGFLFMSGFVSNIFDTAKKFFDK
jgi:hypothetical protein